MRARFGRHFLTIKAADCNASCSTRRTDTGRASSPTRMLYRRRSSLRLRGTKAAKANTRTSHRILPAFGSTRDSSPAIAGEGHQVAIYSSSINALSRYPVLQRQKVADKHQPVERLCRPRQPCFLGKEARGMLRSAASHALCLRSMSALVVDTVITPALPSLVSSSG
jgi:hypothetical protein